ncbi:MAG: cytochrome c3 family protein, partial [Chlorobi bacterium]|nr:cytochrome c3 family protein [Chlorobiota bacterium]
MMLHIRLYVSFAAILVACVMVLGLAQGPDDLFGSDGHIRFSHKTHVDNEVECTTCHEATESISAKDNLVPKPEVCVDCHDEPDVRGFWNLTAHDPLDKSYIT